MIYIILEESDITYIVCIVQYASVHLCGRYMYMTVLFTELQLTPRKLSPYKLIVDKSQIQQVLFAGIDVCFEPPHPLFLCMSHRASVWVKDCV